jgi:nucleoside-diphosphate-sugar epimerase
MQEMIDMTRLSRSAEPIRVLVTGCAGFIGSHLSERLLELGHEVVGADCFTSYYARALKMRNLDRLREDPAFEFREQDLSREPLDGLLDGVQVVFHLAAQPGVRRSFGDSFGDYVRHNVLATQRLLEAAAASAVRRFVYASSSSVYGDAARYPTTERCRRQPRSPYGMTKLATEELSAVYVRTHGVHAVGLRYFTAYGPRQRPDMAFARFLAAALAQHPLRLMGDGSQGRDFTFIDDVVEGTIAAAERGRAGAVYNIGGGCRVRLLDAVRLIEDLLGREIAIERVPRALGDVRDTCADPERARRELGFEPRTALAEGLQRQVQWSLENAAPLVAAVAG